MSFRISGLFSSRSHESSPVAHGNESGWLSGLWSFRRAFSLDFALLTKITTFLFLVTAFALWHFFSVLQSRTAYVATIGEVRTLAERFQGQAFQASAGENNAFAALAETRDRFRLLLDTLKNGGDVEAGHLDSPPGQVNQQLARLSADFTQHAANVDLVVAQSAPVIAVVRANKSLGESIALVRYFADDVVQQKAGPQGLQLVLAMQKLQTSSAIVAAGTSDEQAVAVLKNDAEQVKNLLASVDPARVADNEVRQRLERFSKTVGPSADAIRTALTKPREFIEAQRAASTLGRSAEQLVVSANELEKTMLAYLYGRLAFPLIIVGLSVFAMSFVVLELLSIARSNSAEEVRQREAAEQASESARREKDMTQQAILRRPSPPWVGPRLPALAPQTRRSKSRTC